MKTLNYTAAALAAAILLTGVSCTVKEDRSGCPSYVTVNVDEFIRKGFSEGTVTVRTVRIAEQPALNLLEYLGDGYTTSVPRAPACVSVVSGLDRCAPREGGGLLAAPDGVPFDPVWAYSEEFIPEGDDYLVKALPHKQYCAVHFRLEDVEDPLAYPFVFRLRAATRGMDILTLAPAGDGYVTTVRPNVLGEFTGILPRQADNNMLLDVVLPDSDPDGEGEVYYTVDLGKKFAQKGYDWTKVDLDDIEVTVNFACADVEVRIIGWDRDDSYTDVVI